MRRKTAVIGVVAAAAVAAGAATVANAATAAAPDLGSPQIVATGLSVPWGLGFLPDGSALVTERTTGKVLQLRPGSTPAPLTTIKDVQPGNEGGTLGLAVSPTFDQDKFIYVYFTAARDNRIVRFSFDTPADQQVILSGLAKEGIHNGGRLEFGPDGKLYAGVGDANNLNNAQNDASLNGKILRINPDGSVPDDNPVWPTVGRTLAFSKGHRNVQGFAWDAGGNMYSSEFGQNTFDEVNHIEAGKNYGWPTVEGQGTDPAFTNPIVTWRTSEASPSGAAIIDGTYYTAATRGQRLWTIPLDGNGGTAGAPVAFLQNQFGRLRTVEKAPDGSLWLTTTNRDGRGSPVTDDDRVIRFPAAG